MLLVLSLFLPPAISAQTDKKTLVVGVRTDAPPFSSQLAGSDGKYQGFSVSLCEEIAARAVREGLYCDWRFEKVTATDRFNMLVAGDIQLLCGATTVTLERERAVDFSLLTFIDRKSVV